MELVGRRRHASLECSARCRKEKIASVKACSVPSTIALTFRKNVYERGTEHYKRYIDEREEKRRETKQIKRTLAES